MKVELARPKAYFDIAIGGSKVGRIVFELYEDLAPKASENFFKLCTNKSEISYKGNYFHRVVKNFVIQAGDLEYGKFLDGYPHEKIGTGNVSSFGSLFDDENLTEPLDGPFKLCMANNGELNANGSQFFITTYPQPHLNGKHSVFGRVVHGKSVIREIERVSTDKNNVPNKDQIVLIEDCGEWEEGMDIPAFNANYDTIGGDIFEEYPDDDGHIDKESSESVYNAASKIKESGTLLFKKGEKQQAYLKYRKCLRYIMEFIPDDEQEPKWYKNYVELKKKIYLNLSLVCLQLKNYQKAIDYSSYLLEMDGVSNQERAKAHFRKGSSLIELKKYQLALEDLKEAKSLVPDDLAINRELNKVEEMIQLRKKKEKAKYAKFFS